VARPWGRYSNRNRWRRQRRTHAWVRHHLVHWPWQGRPPWCQKAWRRFRRRWCRPHWDPPPHSRQRSPHRSCRCSCRRVRCIVRLRREGAHPCSRPRRHPCRFACRRDRRQARDCRVMNNCACPPRCRQVRHRSTTAASTSLCIQGEASGPPSATKERQRATSAKTKAIPRSHPDPQHHRARVTSRVSRNASLVSSDATSPGRPSRWVLSRSQACGSISDSIWPPGLSRRQPGRSPGLRPAGCPSESRYLGRHWASCRHLWQHRLPPLNVGRVALLAAGDDQTKSSPVADQVNALSFQAISPSTGFPILAVRVQIMPIPL
jgi:hypothetical protein